MPPTKRRGISPGSGLYASFTEVRPGDYAPDVYAMSAVATALGRQRFFLAGSGRRQLAAAGFVRGTVANPANSGRRLYVARMAGLTTGTAWARLFVNPTAGLPVEAPRPTLNAVVGAGPPVGVLRIDSDLVTGLSGGIDTGIDLGMAANARVSLDLPPLVLSPGLTLGINVPFAGAADAALSVYWWEEDV